MISVSVYAFLQMAIGQIYKKFSYKIQLWTLNVLDGNPLVIFVSTLHRPCITYMMTCYP